MEKKTLQSIIREIPKTGTILENVFYNSNLEEENYDIPFTFLCFLENLAYFNSFKSNYIVDVDETIIPLALYTMSFLGSGDKKDTAFDKIRTYLFSSFVQERKAEVLLKYEERKKAIVEEIENEYAGLKMEDTAMTQTKKREAVNEKLKNLRLPEADFLSIDDTFEGLVTERIWYQSIGLGCPFVKSSEAVSFFQNAGADREPLLRHIIEAYDTGNGQGKTTKGEGKSLSITNVPIALHMHSTATDDLPKRLSHFLDIGGSRRCIIYAPD
ncbi:MAG: hypothetical protein EOM19_08500, partial [Candidatus Moranbacteria bacterium]|nr:hypothetical protein [Candidatus Moranbacteria bacterium]